MQLNVPDPRSFLAMVDSLGAKGIVGTALLGLIVGAVAKIIMPGRDPGGIIITALLGIAGSWLATYLGHRFGLFTVGHVPGFIAAVVGALLILLVYRIIFRQG